MKLVALPDSYQTNVGTQLIVSAPGPLANDKNYAGGQVTMQVMATPPRPDPEALPQHGQLTSSPDGSFIYTPDPGYAGTDWFWYRAVSSIAGVPPTPWTPVTITVGRAMIRQCAACLCSGIRVTATVGTNGFYPFVNQSSGGLGSWRRFMVKNYDWQWPGGGARYRAQIVVDPKNSCYRYTEIENTGPAIVNGAGQQIGDVSTPDWSNKVYDEANFSGDQFGAISVSVTMSSLYVASDFYDLAKALLDLTTQATMQTYPYNSDSFWTYANSIGTVGNSFLDRFSVWPGILTDPGVISNAATFDGPNVLQTAAQCFQVVVGSGSNDNLGIILSKSLNSLVGDACIWDLKQISGVQDSFTCIDQPIVGGVCATQLVLLPEQPLVVVSDYEVERHFVGITPSTLRKQPGPEPGNCCIV